MHLKNLLITGTTQRALELPSATGELEFSTVVDAGANSPAAPCAVRCSNLAINSSIIVQ